MKGIVKHHDETVLRDLGGGSGRRILAWNEQMMLVEVEFEAGAKGAPHSHPHVQSSYMLSGKFTYTVEDESTELNPGDCVVVPGGLVHSTVCLEKGVLLDTFTPCRENFLA